MKENTLDVLFYLFDNYPEVDDGGSEDKNAVNAYLQSAGFTSTEINRALDWLESLGDEAMKVAPLQNPNSAIRVFTAAEQRALNPECQSYLIFMEQAGMIDGEAREQIIERVMVLDDDDFDIEKFKWVALMVLANRPEEEDVHLLWADSLGTGRTTPVYH